MSNQTVMPAQAGIHLSVAKAVAMRQKGGWVYIMTNRPNGTLYIGVTSDLIRRASQHRAGELKDFTWIPAFAGMTAGMTDCWSLAQF